MIARLPVVPGLLVLLFCLTSWAPRDAKAETLEDALTAAYLNNPTLLGQRARLRVIDEQVPQAIANWRPTVEVTGAIERQISTNTARTFGGQDQIRTIRGGALEVTQPLFRGGRTLAATRGAENTVLAERARLTSTEQDVLLRAATAFLDVFRDEAVLRLNINNEQVLTRQLAATRDRFEVGEITRTDVHQAQARLARATADRIDAEGNLETARATYQNLVGDKAPKNLATPDKLPDQPQDLSEVLKAAEAENPDVTSAELDKKAAQDNVDEVRGELLPTVELNVAVRRDFENVSNTNISREETVGASVTVPLYQQGAVYSRLREAKQEVAQQQQTIDEARRDAVETATRAWESLVTARAQVKAFKTAVDANEVALEGVEREAQVGSRTVLDVLDAEQELLDSRVNHTRAQRDELVAIFEVKAAMGQLTARAMQLPVSHYDPTEHYREVRDKWFGTGSKGGAE
ncbi:MAG: TolC family outer membrane protein [Rhodospirillales bacterium]